MLKFSIQSGTIAAIEHDDEKDILIVTFRSKKGLSKYEYAGVPVKKIEEMKESSKQPGFTHGKWISKNIVRGGYKYKPIV